MCCVLLLALVGALAEPLLMYGGAWKGPHAEQNVLDALALGFRSFDTANVYPASYNETAMGVALERARAAGLRREDLFMQTKFTPGISTDHCADGPWDPEQCMFDKQADLATQVKQSAQTSLAHLRVQQLDSLVLHDMRQPWADLQVIWRAMEEVHAQGHAASLGVSHAHDPATFRRLLSFARVPPSFVQNPIFAINHWDRDIRLICREHGIGYQAYSLNHVANDFVYRTAEVKQIARRLDQTPQQVIVAMTKRLGLLPLVGPQDPIKMAQAIAAARHLPARLTSAEVTALENIAFSGVDTGSKEDAAVEITFTNHLTTDVFLAWQHPDHTHLRKLQGMHAMPERIAAGETSSLGSVHRHGFYVWDAAEGAQAPLHREAASQRWVRRVRADGFQGHNDVSIDQSFQVVVANLGAAAKEVFFVGNAAGVDDLISQGVVQGGGSLSITTYDGHTFEIPDADGTSKRVTVRRSGGDPQLLPMGGSGGGSEPEKAATHGEL